MSEMKRLQERLRNWATLTVEDARIAADALERLHAQLLNQTLTLTTKIKALHKSNSELRMKLRELLDGDPPSEVD